VAVGAAIQAGVLGGEVKDVLLLDVTPLTLGVETLGSVMTPILERNTTIPAKRSQVFSTAEDSQSAVDIHVLQGERTSASDNISLGRFRLDGIPAAPRGAPQVEVTFDMDANGILNVTAKDKATGREQKVTITASTNLSQSDIDRMVTEAKAHEADDARQRELVEARNAADNLAYQVDKALKDKGAEVPSELRGEAENLVTQLRQTATGNELNRIRTLSQQAQQLLDRIQQAGAAQPGEPVSGSNGHQSAGDNPEGEVVEGDFKDA